MSKYKLIGSFLVIFLILNSRRMFSQNLVDNGNFENFINCENPSLDINHCVSWYNPNSGTSDYFNSCNVFLSGTPSNGIGFQNAQNGDGYIGFFQYSNQDPFFTLNGREYA